MSSFAIKWIPVVSLVVGCLAAHAFAQSPATAGDRLHAEAIASFQKARLSEAYGGFISLADGGHAPAAELALWMYLNGPSLFGTDWDRLVRRLAPPGRRRLHRRTGRPCLHAVVKGSSTHLWKSTLRAQFLVGATPAVQCWPSANKQTQSAACFQGLSHGHGST